MSLRLLASRLHRTDLRTRMPFRYGIATMTAVPHLFLEIDLEIDGARQAGLAADHLPPKWFTKDPARDPVDEIDDMFEVIRHAADTAAALAPAPTLFAWWRELYHQQAAWAADRGFPPLLAHFGTSLVERAALDAFTRHTGRPFHALLRDNAFGLELGALHPELAGTAPADWLPHSPPARVTVRHTVGLSDPLTAADAAPGEAPDDGLPFALDDCIDRYGLHHFKIKLSGQRTADLDRLEAIAALLAVRAPADYRFTLDGNENFPDFATLRAFWSDWQARPALAAMTPHLLFIEQPLHRDVALAPAAAAGLHAWPDRPPIIIDESDAELGSLRQALAAGYVGTSHKNCKGIFKGVANACRLAQLRRERPAAGYRMSGEDLSNIGPIALLQDLAVQAALGNTSVERNGHHYFAGLSMWPPEMQTHLLQHHGDLYAAPDTSWPRLTLTAGELSTTTINAAPFGLHPPLPLTTSERVDRQ